MGKVKIMKDPCDSCLVKVTCWQLCSEKKNYDTLLKNAIGQYKNSVTKYFYRKDFQKYLDLMTLNNHSIAKITKRAMEIAMSQKS